MKTLVRSALCISLFCFLTSTGDAQLCGKFGIKIFVLDQSGKPVKNALIKFNPEVLGIKERKLERDQNDQSLFVLTMLEGDVDQKKYQLNVTAPGFAPMQVNDVVLSHCIRQRVIVRLAKSSGASKTKSSAYTYNDRWWDPATKEGAPDWEILPQEAKPGELILTKRNRELGLLSNFAATPFEFHGKRYASLEGFWQMMLYPEDASDPRAKAAGVEWKYTREQVAQMTSFDAKAAGTLAEENMKKIGIDWASFEGKRFPYRSQKPGEHYRLIGEAMNEKVNQNPNVKEVLLATEGLILKPDHHEEKNAPPEWHYYEILMQIRSSLKKGN
jgi:predicted NAD-dependent protein-ADP-ribosyltransferase YbiA (DUF1768 family)